MSIDAQRRETSARHYPSPPSPAPEPGFAGQSAIEAIDLNIYYGNFRAIKDANLKIAPQKITAIIGPSGSGKSTMLRAFNRMNELVPSAHATGQVLFNAMTCAGCHSGYAGGGMGPSLRDSTWIYGNSDAQIYSTIVEGRPNGMPAWGAKLPEEQIWKIIAYLRTLGTSNEPVKPPKPAYTVYKPPK